MNGYAIGQVILYKIPIYYPGSNSLGRTSWLIVITQYVGMFKQSLNDEVLR